MKPFSALAVTALIALLPVAAQAQDWTGPYVGVTLGHGTGDVTNPLTSTFDLGGEAYGLYAGYLYQNGSLVYGGELAYQSAAVDLDALPGQGFDQLVDLKGRLGYAAGPVLFYGVLGYSSNRYAIPEGTSRGDGPAFGLGLDYQLSERVMLGAEYMSRSMKNGLSGGVNPVESDISTLSVRMALRF
ncbi:MAG: porin family protein [Tabrizicola sp.]|nr:porin family protein [Tabrizicola sp.]